MKICTLLALLAIILPCAAEEPTLHLMPVKGWGLVINPAVDCTFRAEEGKLTITVPGSTKPHDLSAELASSTAPRVVQGVKGDFIIQVRVDGEFQPGDQSTQAGRTGYTGAGLAVFADETNFIRIERATIPGGEGEAGRAYTNFEMRVNGQLQRYGTTGDFPTDADKPTWLRLERKGQQMLGAMSHDGAHWIYGQPKDLSADAWKRDQIVAGVAAISTSTKPFAPIYSQFSVQNEIKPALENPDSK